MVAPGTEFADQGGRRYVIRPGERGDYDALIGALSASSALPSRVVHAWTLADPRGFGPEAAWRSQDLGFFSLLSLLQALAAAQPEAVALDVLTAGTQDVTGADLTCPQHATVIGIAKVAPLELPWLSARHLDVDPAAGWPSPAAGDLRQLIDELCAAPAGHEEAASAVPGAVPGDEATVALRAGRRWRRAYVPAGLDDEAAGDDGPSGLRDEGVYLVTGGLGGIGITIAEDLATRVRARLVLLARSGLPPREEWDTTLAVRGPADRIGRAITAIRRMESAGAQVLVLAADVTSTPELIRVREQVLARFGRLDGIVHAAGVPGGGMAEVKERQAAQAVLAPKLMGTLALRQAFGDAELDFVVLCSSVYAVSGEFGQLDYCAANNFLDAFARSGHGWRAKVTSVNWGSWLEVGMSAEVAAPAAFRAMQHGERLTPLDHPLLTRMYEGEGPGPGWCSGIVSAGTHWLLADHRIAGVPVIPGTGLLEAARRAFEAVRAAPSARHVIELRDVAFTEPMTVPDGTTAELRVVFGAAAEGLEFQAVSLAGGVQRVHAQGSAAWVEAAEPPPVDLGAVRERCVLDVRSGPDIVVSSTGLVTFGPHWGNLREIRAGVGEELALLTATEAASADLARWPLHPALLDEATAFGRSGFDEQFLPLGYGRITIRGPLPPRVWSYLRHRDAGTEEVRSSDIALLDDAGREIVAIAEFTTRHIDSSALSRTLRDASREQAASGAADLGETLAGGGSDAGIRPDEGARLLPDDRRAPAWAAGTRLGHADRRHHRVHQAVHAGNDRRGPGRSGAAARLAAGCRRLRRAAHRARDRDRRDLAGRARRSGRHHRRLL